MTRQQHLTEWCNFIEGQYAIIAYVLIALMIIGLLVFIGYCLKTALKSNGTMAGYEKFNPKSVKKDEYGNVEFTIKCKMKERWVNQFCSLLKEMEDNGNAGHTSVLAFMADGDGDFRPKFDFHINYTYEFARLHRYNNGNVDYEAAQKLDNLEIEHFFDAG